MDGIHTYVLYTSVGLQRQIRASGGGGAFYIPHICDLLVGADTREASNEFFPITRVHHSTHSIESTKVSVSHDARPVRPCFVATRNLLSPRKQG